MKLKIIVVVFCLAGFFANSQTKVGTINSEFIVGLMPEAKEVLKELYEISGNVVKELSLKNDFAKEVYNSYTSFQEKTKAWNEISIKSYLNI